MIASVSRRSEFAALRSHGQSVRHGALRMRFADPPTGVTPATTYQVAFAINRKFGTAVERNRARRRLKAAFVALTETEQSKPPFGLYLLLPSRKVLSLSYQDLLDTLGACFGRVKAEA